MDVDASIIGKSHTKNRDGTDGKNGWMGNDGELKLFMNGEGGWRYLTYESRFMIHFSALFVVLFTSLAGGVVDVLDRI